MVKIMDVRNLEGADGYGFLVCCMDELDCIKEKEDCQGILELPLLREWLSAIGEIPVRG